MGWRESTNHTLFCCRRVKGPFTLVFLAHLVVQSYIPHCNLVAPFQLAFTQAVSEKRPIWLIGPVLLAH